MCSSNRKGSAAPRRSFKRNAAPVKCSARKLAVARMSAQAPNTPVTHPFGSRLPLASAQNRGRTAVDKGGNWRSGVPLPRYAKSASVDRRTMRLKCVQHKGDPFRRASLRRSGTWPVAVLGLSGIRAYLDFGDLPDFGALPERGVGFRGDIAPGQGRRRAPV